MHKHLVLTQSLLWAAAIVASALLRAPIFLTLLLLPALGTIGLLANLRPASRPGHRQ